MDACLEPKKINMYRANQSGNEPQKDKDDSIQVSAGFNHSMALARSGKAYSWGYAGKGLLGREKVLKDADPSADAPPRETHMLALPVGLGIAFNQTFKATDTAFIWDNLFENIEGLHQRDGEDKAGQAHLIASKMEDEEETVKQIACSSANTVALTRSGEVHVLGDNTYSQRGCEELSDDPDQIVDAEMKDKEESEYGKYARTTKINFPFKTPDKIAYIACGGDHIFAKS
jgi:alpha-tubulin suppressor-like RCC1 family protein